MARLPSLTARQTVRGRTTREPLLRSIVKDAGLSVEAFLKLL
jgi:hypothetical protein